jgi:Arc/MetJ family transcription regulator
MPYVMKMTMHIDEELLDRVIETYGFQSKTDAVEVALQEMDRRFRWKAFAKRGLGFKPDELAASVDPDYDVMKMRLAEKPMRHGKKCSR